MICTGNNKLMEIRVIKNKKTLPKIIMEDNSFKIRLIIIMNTNKNLTICKEIIIKWLMNINQC
jgi:hypothetical protein